MEDPPHVLLRRELLRRLAACERGIERACRHAAHRREASRETRHAAEVLTRVHRARAARLEARLIELGGSPADDPDPLWVPALPERRIDARALRDATRIADDTLHDALADFDGPSRAIIERLLGEEAPLPPGVE